MTKSVEYGGKLALVCVVCMLGVAGAYVAAKDRIDEGKEAAFRVAIREVLGLTAGDPDPEALNPDEPKENQVFTATVEGEKRYAAQGGHTGFSSTVVVAVGARMVEGSLVVIEVRVISQNETPGLGTRIQDQETNLTLWSRVGNAMGAETEEVKDWAFLKQFREKGIDQMAVTGDAAEADRKIVKITGVTITTNATVVACRKALERIWEFSK